MRDAPCNGIHGWVYLDDTGAVQSSRPKDPISRLQLVFFSGPTTLGLLPEVLLPRYDRALLYMHYLRPPLVAFIRWVASLSILLWLSQFVFGVIVCVVRPYSEPGTISLSRTTADSKTTASIGMFLLTSFYYHTLTRVFISKLPKI